MKRAVTSITTPASPIIPPKRIISIGIPPMAPMPEELLNRIDLRLRMTPHATRTTLRMRLSNAPESRNFEDVLISDRQLSPLDRKSGEIAQPDERDVFRSQVFGRESMAILDSDGVNARECLFDTDLAAVDHFGLS